jgi:hypothetical protein
VGEVPRPQRSAGQALLVTSEQPGYGKSHFIGRLFRALHGRATLVYVQPFQNAATPCHSLLLAVARELHFPDRVTSEARDLQEPTQLDHLAHAVLAHLLADLISGRAPLLEIDTPPDSEQLLRRNPFAAFGRGADPWAGWMLEHWQKLEPHFEEVLARRGVELQRPAAWLRILRAYAFQPDNPVCRRRCLDWLSGQPLDAADSADLGLPTADSVADSSLAEANARAHQRLIELCQLACFYRPFVFCFDQTEVYGHEPALARAFGMVLAMLVDEARGHLCLITANQDPWQARIEPNIERADLQRIAHPPLVLEGLARSQALELARLRLTAVHVPPRRAEAFLRGSWLDEFFPTEQSQLGPRFFLQKCKERWGEPPAEDLSLAQLYAQESSRLLHAPKRREFEPDPLQWVVEVAARGVAGIEVQSIAERKFAVHWSTPQRHCLFGFQSGSHWRQWRDIARASMERSAASPGSHVKCVFFRTAEQMPIPSPTWASAPEIEEAKRQALHLIVLSPEDQAGLYAARDLYAQAAQGDIGFSPEEVLEFLRTELAPWWERLAGPIGTEAPGESPEHFLLATPPLETAGRKP